jgi:MFS family permease
MIFFQDVIALIVIFFIFGFFIGRVYLISLELLLKQSTSQKGAKAGLFESAIGLGGSLSPLVSGLLAGWNLLLPFLFYAIISFLAFLFNFIFMRQKSS